ncbi:hypothetical protein LguiA_028496 [Lonicera macranthoides]
MVNPQTCEAVSVARLGGVGKNSIEPKVIRKKVQCQIIKTGFESASSVVESLFNLKMVVLGVNRINYVRKIFNDMFIRPVELWNQMISGKCKGFVERMPEKNIMSWNSMIGLYAGCGDIGLSSKLERYGCMTDLLCRNGLLEEAEDLVKRVSFKAEEENI